MTEPEIPSVERLRELADARVRAQIAAAKLQAAAKRTSRQQFARNRQAGVNQRNALRAARLRLANHHNEKDQP